MKPQEIIRATRWPAALFFALLVIGSYNLCHYKTSSAILPAIATFIFYVATVVHNNWCDRHRDAIGGNDTALLNERDFLHLTRLVWIVAVIALSCLVFQHYYRFLLGALILILGATYQRTERIVGLPIIIVATCCALPILFPWLENPHNYRVTLFGFAIFLLMIPREIMKDFKDLKQDADPKFGKATLPIIIGKEKAIALTKTSLILSSVVITLILATVQPCHAKSYLFWALTAIIWSVFLLETEHEIAKSQMALDIGLGIAAITLAILWPILH